MEKKVYNFIISLFTCATSRAVHLEAVTDLSVLTILLVFRCFAAQRSLPQVIMSDNATIYTFTTDELTALLTSEEIRTAMGRKDIEWKFTPKAPPGLGNSYWERLIGRAKE